MKKNQNITLLILLFLSIFLVFTSCTNEVSEMINESSSQQSATDKGENIESSSKIPEESLDSTISGLPIVTKDKDGIYYMTTDNLRMNNYPLLSIVNDAG